MPGSTTLFRATTDNEIVNSPQQNMMPSRQPPPVAPRTPSVTLQSWQSATSGGDSSFSDERHIRSASMDSLESSGSSSSGCGSVANHRSADSNTGEYIPTRTVGKAPKLPSHNPLQFVKVQSPLYKKAEQQIKLTKEVKITREALKEGEEEWQSNLDNWKSRRRKISEKVIQRAEEMRQIEAEEQLRQEQLLLQQKKIKKFSEIVEKRSSSRNYNLDFYIGQGDDSGLGGTPEPDETIDCQNSILRSDTSEGMTSEAESVDSDIQKSEKVSDKNPPKVPAKPHSWLKKELLNNVLDNNQSPSQNELFQHCLSKKDLSTADNISSAEPSDIEGHAGDTETVSSEEDNSYCRHSVNIDSELDSLCDVNNRTDLVDSASDLSQDSCNGLEKGNCKINDLSEPQETEKCKSVMMEETNIKNTDEEELSFKICIKQGDNKGFGFTLKGGKDQGCPPYLDHVTKGGPADRTGLKEGDKIISLNGELTAGYSHASLIFSIKQAIYTGILDVVICRPTKKVNQSSEMKTKHSTKVSAFAEKLALFSTANNMHTSSAEDPKVVSAKPDEIKRESLVLRRRSAFENGKTENSVIINRRSSCVTQTANSLQNENSSEKRLSADLTQTQPFIQENGVAKKGRPPPIPVKPKIKYRAFLNEQHKSEVASEENNSSSTNNSLHRQENHGVEPFKGCDHTSFQEFSSNENINESFVMSSKLETEINSNILDKNGEDDAILQNEQTVAAVSSFKDSNEIITQDSVHFNSDGQIQILQGHNFNFCESEVPEKVTENISMAETKECNINSAPVPENNLTYEGFGDFSYANSDVTYFASESLYEQSNLITGVISEPSIKNEHNLEILMKKSDLQNSVKEITFMESEIVDCADTPCHFAVEDSQLNDDLLYSSACYNVCNTAECDNSVKNDQFYEENRNTAILDNSDGTENMSSPLCLPLEKIDEDDVISASTTTSSETPDTETVIETAPSNFSPLPNDESNGEDSAEQMNVLEVQMDQNAENVTNPENSWNQNDVNEVPQSSQIQSNNSEYFENELLNEALNYSPDKEDEHKYIIKGSEDDEYCRELDESIDQITSLDVIDEIEQRLMHQLEQEEGPFELQENEDGLQAQLEQDISKQWLYFTDEVELLEDLTPRKLEPPSEPPPPPPPPEMDISERKAVSVARTNSTKRIKKELWRRRSDFLGLDSPEGVDVDNIPPPPPGLEEILKQEREQSQWLEKRLSLAETEDSVFYSNECVSQIPEDFSLSDYNPEYFVEEREDNSEIATTDAENGHWKENYEDQSFFDASYETQYPSSGVFTGSVPDESSKLTESPQHKAKQNIQDLGAAPKAKIMDSNKWITEKVAPVSRKSIEPVFRQSNYNQNYWLAQDGELKQSLQYANTHTERRYSMPPPSTNHHPDVTVRTWGDREYEFQQQRPRSAVWNKTSNGGDLYGLYSQTEKQDVLRTRSLDSHRDMNCDTNILESEVHSCSCCGKGLCEGSAMGIEALRLYFHIECFRCCICHTQLGNGSCGTDVQVKNNQLYCPNCFTVD
ncbi:LIM and calponin domains-containing protein 1, partial [Stegodyphus mimosarum]